MRLRPFLMCLLALALPLGRLRAFAQSSCAISSENFVGAWKLVSIETIRPMARSSILITGSIHRV